MQKESARHRQEKEELMQRLERGRGKWDTSHPRHRLLDALHGFRKYFDRNAEDVNRWKRLYKGVSRDQKKVGSHGKPGPPHSFRVRREF